MKNRNATWNICNVFHQTLIFAEKFEDSYYIWIKVSQDLQTLKIITDFHEFPILTVI